MNKDTSTYLEWLHQLTTELYEYDIMLTASDGDKVRKLYDDGLTVAFAREKIIHIAQNKKEW